MKYLVAYDLETTGTNIREDEIIQIAGYICDFSGEIVDSFERKVEFTRELAYNETPYRPDLWVREAVPLPEALLGFREWMMPYCWEAKVGRMGGVYNAIPPLGYNTLAFDHNILIRDSKACDIFVPMSYPGFDLYSIIPWIFNFRTVKPLSYRLSDVCDYYGIELRFAHDARGDAMACCELLGPIFSDLSETLSTGLTGYSS